LVDFGEELGEGGGPEALEELVIFLGADALVDNVGSGAGLRDAVAHEGFAHESERAFTAAKGLPGMPVDIALEVRFEDVAGAVFGNEGDSGAADGAAEVEKRALCKFGF